MLPSAAMIVLEFADHDPVKLSDADAQALAGLLWDMAPRARTATVAASIQQDLHRSEVFRHAIAVSGREQASVLGAIERLH